MLVYFMLLQLGTAYDPRPEGPDGVGEDGP